MTSNDILNENQELDLVESINCKDSDGNNPQKELITDLTQNLENYHKLMADISNDWDKSNPQSLVSQLISTLKKIQFDPYFYRKDPSVNIPEDKQFLPIDNSDFQQVIQFMDKHYLDLYTIHSKRFSE